MTMAEAKKIYRKGGGHFFDTDTLRFWGSRIESSLYKNRCFITSEDNYDGSKRYYNVRRFNEDYTRIEDMSEFNTIENKEDAIRLAKEA